MQLPFLKLSSNIIFHWNKILALGFHGLSTLYCTLNYMGNLLMLWLHFQRLILSSPGDSNSQSLKSSPYIICPSLIPLLSQSLSSLFTALQSCWLSFCFSNTKHYFLCSFFLVVEILSPCISYIHVLT